MSLSSVPSVLFPDLPPLHHHHHHHHQYQQQFIIIVPFALSLTWWCRQAGSRGFIRSRYNSHIHSCHAPPLFVCLRPPSIVLHRKWGASSSPPTTILLSSPPPNNIHSDDNKYSTPVGTHTETLHVNAPPVPIPVQIPLSSGGVLHK